MLDSILRFIATFLSIAILQIMATLSILSLTLPAPSTAEPHGLDLTHFADESSAATPTSSSPASEAAMTPVGDAPIKLWLRNAWLLDPSLDSGPYLADVLIADGRIADIRRVPSKQAEEISIDPEIPSVDAEYRFLMPGFIDTHVHLSLGPVSVSVVDGQPSLKIEEAPEVVPRSLRSLLANGITTVRDPGGDTEALVALKKQLENGERIGPRMRVAGAVIDRTAFDGLTARVDGPEQVRAEVRRQAEAGVDWIKLYTQLSREELAAGIDEAHQHDLKAVAHLQRIPWTDAARMGIDGLVHGVPGSELLLPEAARQAYLPDLVGTQFLYSWFEHADLDSPLIEEMIQALKMAGTTLDLTLVAFEAMVHGDRAHRTRHAPDLQWAAPSLVENWRAFFTFNIGWQPQDFERARRAWPKALELARLLHESGIHLTVGTDANNPWTVPGPSFHRELELLSAAGIPNRDILRMATIHGAQALDLDHEVGRIQPGAVADLVLLERDPTTDISATRDVVWVMRNGRIHEPTHLLESLHPSNHE